MLNYIIAKILANHLVVVFGDIVNEVQSAFVANRNILDGSFILNELFHWCKKKKKQTKIFKVDFEKAYDSVRWDYLDDVLKKFGFGDRCLKHGDPLSPFLYILIMESLHILVQSVVDEGMFRGGLGVSSIYALNRALLFKWVCRFRTQGSSLWARVIKGIHGKDGKLGKNRGDGAFKSLYPRIYALETYKNVTVIVKMSLENVGYSLRRIPRGGIEQVQFLEFLASMEGVALVDMMNRWVWSLDGLGEFSIAYVQRLIDER
ncbi:RNA-directed DNA polymerase, eukaryota, reverse transcriptase zinc-binding domain protein [Tanacetum coccineum]